MMWLMIGGPGRSGTSYFSSALLNHPEIFGFPNLELKLLSNIDGLFDLYLSMVVNYSPDRTRISLGRFINLSNNLSSGDFFGQLGIEKYYNVPIKEIIDNFVTDISKNGLPIHQSKNEFFFKSRNLLNQIAEVGLSKSSIDKQPQYFLEKTPHNLLQIKFLSELFPDAIYIHVMRDPRSIAMSLSKMKWGPSSLITCAEWVNQYLIEWKTILDWSKESTVNLIEIYIEDIAREKTLSSIEICRALEINVDENLFKSAKLSVLNDWSLAVDKKDFELLNNILEHWIDYYGYSLEKVGVRS